MNSVVKTAPIRRIASSIITRILLLGAGIALVSGVGRYFLLSDFLREDLARVVAAQQEALAGYVARDIDRKLVERRRMLTQLAATLPPALLEQPEALRAWLAERHALQPLFSQGLFVTGPDGVALADFPAQPGRRGTRYADRDYVQAALGGAFAIGSPVLGRAVGEPVLPMALPVKDGAGRVRAVLAGITGLTAPGFLDLLGQIHIGETGGFLLIAPREQIFVAATKPELVFKPTAAPGVNPLHDRAMAGFRGSGVTVNAQGVEEVSAIASVPSSGWFLVARIPTAEAFATVQRTRSYVLRNTAITVAVFVLLGAAGLYLLFRPVIATASHADRMTLGEQPLEPLPVQRRDEVGHLTEAFNRLLEKLLATQRELTLMAHHDALTGLPNRLLLADRLSQALARAQRRHSRVAVLFLDLDGFKPINDVYGHEAGDAALIEIARRIGAIVREADTLARIGGDEFVLLMADLDAAAGAAAAAAAAVAAKCIAAVEQPMTLRGERLTLGLSIGVALGDGASSADALMLAADQAMYRAKQAGRGHYVMADS